MPRTAHAEKAVYCPQMPVNLPRMPRHASPAPDTPRKAYLGTRCRRVTALVACAERASK